MNLSITDMLVIAGVATAVAFPKIKSVLLAVAGKINQRNLASGPTVADWRQDWPASLITLKSEIEDGVGEVPNEEEACRLCSALIWELIGGTEE